MDEEDLQEQEDEGEQVEGAEGIPRRQVEVPWHGPDEHHVREDDVVGRHERHHLVHEGAVGVRHHALVGDDPAVDGGEEGVDEEYDARDGKSANVCVIS